MASPVPDSPRVRFGPFEMDPSAGRLLKSGIHLKLQPQPFRVLLLLTSRAGQVVTREEIQSHLWGDSTFVDFERGINFSINQIRGVLCDDAEWGKTARRFTPGGQGVDLVVETAGAATLKQSMRATKLGGQMRRRDGDQRHRHVLPSSARSGADQPF